MHEQDKAILKSLVAVAWADGKFASEEKEMLEALISAFDASEREATEVRDFAATKRNIEDIQLSHLSPDDRRTLLNHAVVLTFIDGNQAAEEKALIDGLAKRLDIPGNEAERIIQAAEARAQRLLAVL